MTIAGLVLTAGLAYGVHVALSGPGDQKPANSSQASASAPVAPPAAPRVDPPSSGPALDEAPPREADRIDPITSSEGGAPALLPSLKPQKVAHGVNRPAARLQPQAAAQPPAQPTPAPPAADPPRPASAKRVDALGY